MTARAARLTDVFAALKTMQERLEWSLHDDAHLFPVAASSVRDRRTAESLDAFLKRFEQTTDHILRRLFPALVAAAEIEYLVRPLLDVLDQLHRLGVIDDPATWVRMIDLRNRLVHDYALDAALLAGELNAAWGAAPMLIVQIATARRYAEQHELLMPKASS